MSKEYSKAKKIVRKSWRPGPWDEEPDYYEWTTAVGYEAYASRLDTGVWFGIVIAPLPGNIGPGAMGFYHTLRDKRDQLDHRIGLTSYSDVEGMGEYCLSMEHYESPAPSDKKEHHGQYKTLEEVKQIVEDIAGDIYQTHKEGTYVNYFQR